MMDNTKIRLIRIAEVLSKTGFKKAWIYQLISNGSFPKPVKLGSRAVAFIEDEVEQWIAERIKQSRR